MKVSLTRDLDRFVADKVKSGRYTASEVIRDALRLMVSRSQQLHAFTPTGTMFVSI